MNEDLRRPKVQIMCHFARVRHVDNLQSLLHLYTNPIKFDDLHALMSVARAREWVVGNCERVRRRLEKRMGRGLKWYLTYVVGPVSNIPRGKREPTGHLPTLMADRHLSLVSCRTVCHVCIMGLCEEHVIF